MADWPRGWSYLAGRRGACPWCGLGVEFAPPPARMPGLPTFLETYDQADSVSEPFLAVSTAMCPACNRVVVSLLRYMAGSPAKGTPRLLYPSVMSRPPLSEHVPPHIAEDYREAALVLADSPKASAALSRRCLQAALREAGKTKEKDLAKQIDEVLATLPPHIAENVDAIRNIGNFAAHPQKSQHTGEVLPVEPHEAEWTLDVLDGLFDFYYVQPAVAKAKRAALDAKLAEVGKPPMKQPVP